MFDPSVVRGPDDSPPVRGAFSPSPVLEKWPFCREVILAELKPKIPSFSAGDGSFRASMAFFRACQAWLDAANLLLHREELFAAVWVAWLSG